MCGWIEAGRLMAFASDYDWTIDHDHAYVEYREYDGFVYITLHTLFEKLRFESDVTFLLVTNRKQQGKFDVMISRRNFGLRVY